MMSIIDINKKEGDNICRATKIIASTKYLEHFKDS